MIDPTSRPDGAATGAPRPHPFDPAAPDASAAGPAVPGAILLLAAGPDRRWAAETAIELASAWARDGRRVVAADLHLESPILHEIAGTPNLEGVVDVFLYGASLSRSAHPVRARGFYLISAGTYEPDADAIYRHPRWAKLVAGFRDANATLVLFAPLESTDLRALAPHVERTVLLGALADDALDTRLAESGLNLSAILVPPASAAWLDDVDDDRAAPAVVPPPAAAEDRELQLPPAPVRPKRRSRRGLYLTLGLLAAVLILAGAGYWISRYRPDLIRGLRPAGTPPDTATPAVVAPPAAPTRAAVPLPYSVQVIAFQTLDPATQHLARQRSQYGEVPFFISTEEIDGRIWFKILAGALPDTAAAQTMREQLVAAGAVDEDDVGSSWDLIQSVPLAFDLGEFASTDEARAASDSLAARQIPVYALPVPYSDGSQRWQLYAGAFRDTTTAGEMRARLVSAGLAARLVPRVGAAATAGAEPQDAG